jgi:hypothetical protein
MINLMRIIRTAILALGLLIAATASAHAAPSHIAFPFPTLPYPIFISQTPAYTTGSASSELGVQFRCSVAGYIYGVCYYRAVAETGTHTGRLWTAGGTLLGKASFINETTSGWQAAIFDTPIAISANTTYVASVNNNAEFAYTPGGLATSIGNGALSTVAGGNGGGVYGASGMFPAQSISTNYFRDVLFSPA